MRLEEILLVDMYPDLYSLLIFSAVLLERVSSEDILIEMANCLYWPLKVACIS
jgi:hypothetical protein